MYLPVHVTGVAVLALVDTGVSHSFVRAKFTAMNKLHIDHDVLMVVRLPSSRRATTDHLLHCKLLIDNVIYV